MFVQYQYLQTYIMIRVIPPPKKEKQLQKDDEGGQFVQELIVNQKDDVNGKKKRQVQSEENKADRDQALQQRKQGQKSFMNISEGRGNSRKMESIKNELIVTTNNQQNQQMLQSLDQKKSIIKGEKNQANTQKSIKKDSKEYDKKYQLVYKMNQINKLRQLKYNAKSRPVVQKRIIKNVGPERYRRKSFEDNQISKSVNLKNNQEDFSQNTIETSQRKFNAGRIVRVAQKFGTISHQRTPEKQHYGRFTSRTGAYMTPVVQLPPLPQNYLNKNIYYERDSILQQNSILDEKKKQLYILEKSKRLTILHQLRKIAKEIIFGLTNEAVERVQQKRRFFAYKYKKGFNKIVKSRKKKEKILDIKEKLSNFIKPKHQRFIQNSQNLHQSFLEVSRAKMQAVQDEEGEEEKRRVKGKPDGKGKKINIENVLSLTFSGDKMEEEQQASEGDSKEQNTEQQMQEQNQDQQDQEQQDQEQQEQKQQEQQQSLQGKQQQQEKKQYQKQQQQESGEKYQKDQEVKQETELKDEKDTNKEQTSSIKQTEQRQETKKQKQQNIKKQMTKTRIKKQGQALNQKISSNKYKKNK